MIRSKSFLNLALFVSAFTTAAWGQAATEYGLAGSHSAATTSKIGTVLQRETKPLTQGAVTSVPEEKRSSNPTAVRSAKPNPKEAKPPAPQLTASPLPAGANGGPLTISVVGGSNTSAGAKPGDKYKRQVQVSFEK